MLVVKRVRFQKYRNWVNAAFWWHLLFFIGLSQTLPKEGALIKKAFPSEGEGFL